MDVLSAHPFVQAFRWFENDPGDTGAKGSFGAGQTIGSAPNATWIRAADLDRDGDPDILAVSFSDNAVRWSENDPSDAGAKGSFGMAQTISRATLDPRSVVAADLDAGQTNGDALPSGDLCQCGDLSGDGPVTATDYDRARELVVGRTPGGPADPDRCDVTGDQACTVEDLAVLERFLASAAVTVQTRCDDWFGP